MISSGSDILGKKILADADFENLYLKYKPFLYSKDIKDLNDQVENFFLYI